MTVETDTLKELQEDVTALRDWTERHEERHADREGDEEEVVEGRETELPAGEGERIEPFEHGRRTALRVEGWGSLPP